MATRSVEEGFTAMQFHKAFVLLGLAAILAFGTAADDSEPLKIGVVDLDQALTSTDEGKKAMEEIQRKQRQAEGQVQPLADQIKAMEEELKGKKFVLSDEARRQKELDYAQKRNEIETRLRELDGQLRIDAERIRGPLVQKLVEAVREVGKDQGYTVIFARGAGGLVYSREAVDITDQVVSKFNSKS